jgi:phosphoribosylcarboxyaminoimidazole (NCAIR) mutase
MLALSDTDMAKKLADFRKAQSEKVAQKNAKLG